MARLSSIRAREDCCGARAHLIDVVCRTHSARRCEASHIASSRAPGIQKPWGYAIPSIARSLYAPTIVTSDLVAMFDTGRGSLSMARPQWLESLEG